MKINEISPGAHVYSSILAAIPSPPKVLFYRGKLPESRRPTVAIVGTRRPTRYGQEIAHNIAFELAKRGVVVVSGLALGVDAIVHKAALEARGTTIAILANSVDVIYPRTNAQLGEHIMQSGAVMSEYAPPMGVRQFQLLARNRLVSGIADALVVIEAAERSGTLSTVNHALEQGKEVFAVPGNITSPLSAGCNRLIQNGATPLLGYEDVLRVIAPELLEPQTTLALGDTPEETTILRLISEGVRDGDDLQTQSLLNAAVFNQTLTMLELKGIIRSLGANQWTFR